MSKTIPQECDNKIVEIVPVNVFRALYEIYRSDEEDIKSTLSYTIPLHLQQVRNRKKWIDLGEEVKRQGQELDDLKEAVSYLETVLSPPKEEKERKLKLV